MYNIWNRNGMNNIMFYIAVYWSTKSEWRRNIYLYIFIHLNIWICVYVYVENKCLIWTVAISTTSIRFSIHQALYYNADKRIEMNGWKTRQPVNMSIIHRYVCEWVNNSVIYKVYVNNNIMKRQLYKSVFNNF